jgi:hypothetical protein
VSSWSCHDHDNVGRGLRCCRRGEQHQESEEATHCFTLAATGIIRVGIRGHDNAVTRRISHVR